MNDVTKLPKWAQEKIANLERDLEHIRADRDKVYALTNGGKSSSIFVEGYNTKPSMFLPEGSDIVFTLANGEELHVQYRFGQNDYDKSAISIRSNWHEMSVSPHAANVVSVTSKGGVKA